MHRFSAWMFGFPSTDNTVGVYRDGIFQCKQRGQKRCPFLKQSFDTNFRAKAPVLLKVSWADRSITGT